MKPSVLVIYGDGINCERETARAFEVVSEPDSISTHFIHVNEFLKKPNVLLSHHIFCVPGGFSFGDELRSGKILAEKMRSSMAGVFETFTQNGGLTLGVCNGFQVLIQLGVFTGITKTRTVTLATNDHGKFLDRWVQVKITEVAKHSPWFKGIEGVLSLPMRHKEGKITLLEEAVGTNLHIPLLYTEAVNGSYQQAAALLDPSGQILGIMPHPEAALFPFLNPCNQNDLEKEHNANLMKQIFKNAIEHVKGIN